MLINFLPFVLLQPMYEIPFPILTIFREPPFYNLTDVCIFKVSKIRKNMEKKIKIKKPFGLLYSYIFRFFEQNFIFLELNLHLNKNFVCFYPFILHYSTTYQMRILEKVNPNKITIKNASLLSLYTVEKQMIILF